MAKSKTTFQLDETGAKINEEQHIKLLKHVREKLDFGNFVRKHLVDRLRMIDNELSGYVIPTGDDAKRHQDNVSGKAPKPVDISLPLTVVQLDECTTFLLNVLAPDNEMYETTAEASLMEQARAFTSVMNQNAIDFQHYRNMGKAFFNGLKYNFGGLITEWEQVIGRGINFDETRQQGEVKFTDNSIVTEGNAVISADPYNFIWDVSVLPVDLPRLGEFFATIQMRTPFRVKKAAQQGIFYNTQDIIDHRAVEMRYYEQKPRFLVEGALVKEGQQINWRSTLQPELNVFMDANSVEIVNTYIWLNPKEFGLSSTQELQIWLISIANGFRIIRAVPLDYAHGMLPCGFFMPWEDESGLDALSYGEMLRPLQHYASFQINTDQHGQRKALNKVTILDRQAFAGVNKEDFRSGVVFADLNYAVDRDIRRVAMQFDHNQQQDAPEQISKIVDLMQYILPTSIQRAMSDLERATLYQAAWTVQAANRRPYKIARIINDQGLEPVRHQMYYNILQFQKSMEIISPENGELLTVNPAQIATARIKFLISTGLKGIDKLQITEGLRDVINMLLQSKAGNDQIDVVRVIDYWLTLMGDRFDFTAFKWQDDFDKLTREQKQVAFQLLQQAIQEQEQQEGQSEQENSLLNLVAGE